MQEQFRKLCENIKLTSSQREDAKVKYSGVCKKIHDHFYSYEYNGDTKLIFGSYSKSKNTAVRPMSEDQDVDVLFKIPEDVFKQYQAYRTGGQSALLQKIRDILLESRYALSENPKAWGKVILIRTADGTHNVELLPAYENEDGSFIIPNSENGGGWGAFNPRPELEKFQKSNDNTSGLTGDLSRMIKRWSREVASVSIKSFEIENFVMNFLTYYDYSSKSYSEIVKDFFSHLHMNVNQDDISYVVTAEDRSSKALEFEKQNKFENATVEWKKIFGDSSFPSANKEKVVRSTLLLGNYSHCEPLRWSFVNSFKININAYLYKPDKKTKVGGVNSDGRNLPGQLWWVKFDTFTNAIGEFQYYWQVVNTGEHARRESGLRGEIFLGQRVRWEQTQYHGKHWIECFIVMNNVCIARSGKFFVNII